MVQFTRVLCPTDLSDFSQRAIDHAAAIAEWYEATLDVLYVFPNLPSMDLPPMVIEDADRERLLTQMRTSTAHVPSSVRLELMIREASDVHAAILAEAQAVGADLLVLGTHGRSGFSRALLGSVAEKVMRKAPCPTMVVPRRAPEAAPDRTVRFGSIVCAVDFSPASQHALRYALDLAQENAGRLTVLHVLELSPVLAEFPLAAPLDPQSVQEGAHGEALQHLDRLIPDSAREYCTVHTSVREGAPYRAILEQAQDEHASLIVMGAQGRRALDEWIFGSNTARVARNAACPVLIIRD